MTKKLREPKYNEEWIIRAIALYKSGKGPVEIWKICGKPGKKRSFSARIYHWMKKAGLPIRSDRRLVNWEKIRKSVNQQQGDYP